MYRRPLLRAGAANVSVLLLIYTLSGLMHPCCLGDVDHEGATAHAVTEASGHHHESEAAHHGSDSESESTCEGMCGLCCESAQSFTLPAPPSAPEAALVAYSGQPSLAASEVLRSRSAFLLPFANGPPVAISIG